jgi:hypothetical protein
MDILGDFCTTDLRKFLNNYKRAIGAVRFVLQTDLLAQFNLVAKIKRAKRLKTTGSSPDNQQLLNTPELNNDENPISASNERDYEPDFSQSDSEYEDISHAERIFSINHENF